MLDVKVQGTTAIIDVRENVLRGEHPKNEVLEYVKNAKEVTRFEIHLPLKGEPMVALLQSIGLDAYIEELGAEHFRIIAKK
ncbi:amino acid decarboxylase [Anaerobacillus isosaccharinicus]|uniref:Amino acid decarboxylase n=1 Tax=Anaerobacillus isosaccharinicus TaxID=1532552 RepID=A0A1S2L5L7_9BACI|nr:amino acid decarboxylase [Anaerobacillus isosaccharinicus]MBA5586363.1 amino acid decarboxylase [Anaerobacillus isosaccharinicus]QOY35391.1 amino acid decarboxylase [Anaerobacillus isosaccharinicus]